MRFASACAAFASISLLAAAPGQATTAQQELMKTCNATATGQSLKGDARQGFMSDCLSGKTSAKIGAKIEAKPMTPQERMKACNTQASGKKGDERKTFMSSCLKG